MTRTEDRADIALDVTTLALLALGYAPLDTIALRRDVEVRGNEETLRQVFVRKNCYFADYY